MSPVIQVEWSVLDAALVRVVVRKLQDIKMFVPGVREFVAVASNHFLQNPVGTLCLTIRLRMVSVAEWSPRSLYC